eukprot:6517846-Pyramimonas_sp.AAC.1
MSGEETSGETPDPPFRPASGCDREELFMRERSEYDATEEGRRRRRAHWRVGEWAQVLAIRWRVGPCSHERTSSRWVLASTSG